MGVVIFGVALISRIVRMSKFVLDPPLIVIMTSFTQAVLKH